MIKKYSVEQEYYLQKVAPYLRAAWVRADSRRVLDRLSMMGTKHRIHLRCYRRLQQMLPEASFKTMARDLLILPFMVDKKILVHDGRKHVLVIPSEREVGLRLGEMVYPKPVVHKHTSKTKVKTIKK